MNKTAVLIIFSCLIFLSNISYAYATFSQLPSNLISNHDFNTYKESNCQNDSRPALGWDSAGWIYAKNYKTLSQIRSDGESTGDDVECGWTLNMPITQTNKPQDIILILKYNLSIPNDMVGFDGGFFVVVNQYNSSVHSSKTFIVGLDSRHISISTNGQWAYLSEVEPLDSKTVSVDINLMFKDAQGEVRIDDVYFALGDHISYPNPTPKDVNLLVNPTADESVNTKYILTPFYPQDAKYAPNYWWTYQGVRLSNGNPDYMNSGKSNHVWDNGALEILGKSTFTNAAWGQTINGIYLSSPAKVTANVRYKTDITNLGTNSYIGMTLEVDNTSGKSWYNSPNFKIVSTDWSDLTMGPFDIDTGTYGFVLNLKLTNATGEVWFDNASLVITSATSPPCTGNFKLALSPSPIGVSSPVKAGITGLSNCDGKTAYVIGSGTVCLCKVSGGECSCSFTSPSTPNTTPNAYSYTAEMDKNGDNFFYDFEKYTTSLNVPKCSDNIQLALPSCVITDSQITASVSGLSYCNGKTANVAEVRADGSMVPACSCVVSGKGCSCTFKSPSYSGNYQYGTFIIGTVKPNYAYTYVGGCGGGGGGGLLRAILPYMIGIEPIISLTFAALVLLEIVVVMMIIDKLHKTSRRKR